MKLESSEWALDPSLDSKLVNLKLSPSVRKFLEESDFVGRLSDSQGGNNTSEIVVRVTSCLLSKG